MITEGCRFECQRQETKSENSIVPPQGLSCFVIYCVVVSNFDLSSATASDRRTLTEDFSSLMKADSRQDEGGNISHVRNLILT